MPKSPKYEYRYRLPQKRHFHIWPILLLLVIAAVIAWPLIEAGRLEVDEHTLTVTNLPANLKNVQIVFASDFHQTGSMSGSLTEKAVAAINNQNADIVILGGDYSDSTEGAIEFFNELPSITARLGVFAILGDCEYTNEDRVSELVGVITGKGITPLVNTVATVKVGQSYLYIAGADDYTCSVPKVAALSSQVTESDFVIFAGHSPELIKDMLSAQDQNGNTHWYDLALFGHTHGGQLNFFGFTPFPSFRLKQVSSRYMQGWLEENRAATLTSNGIGTEFLPMRFRARPQVHVITLKAR